ncbi:MAG TPA: tetratricopeptide repeat protein [Candidatus Acidoferrales bacterium]|nr:tetratricopeptide repeat protein [Candidatus Acidoferrales bacterium]
MAKVALPKVLKSAMLLVMLGSMAPVRTLAQSRGAVPVVGLNTGTAIGDLSAVIVHVQELDGGPLAVPALVILTSLDNPGGYQTTTGAGGIAQFNGVPGGNYTIKVSAAGYKGASEDVTVMGNNGIVNSFMGLKADNNSPDNEAQLEKPGIPLLVGKSRKELDLALAAMRSSNNTGAAPHLAYILKHAPGNPDVQFVAALYAMSVQDAAGARSHLEMAIGIFPGYAAAQIELANLLLSSNEAAGAIPHLEQALSVQPGSWRAHWLIAEAYLIANRDAERAKFHAVKSLELGKEKAAGVQITLARAQAIAGDRDAARKTLEEFLAKYPSSPASPRAKQMLDALGTTSTTPTKVETIALLPLGAAVAGNLFADVPPSSMLHLPRGVDDAVPPVNATIPCSLPQVLEGASRRTREFVVALERFSATEDVIHDELDAAGVTRKSYHRSFNYVAALEHPRPNVIVVDEMRDGSFSVSEFPGALATEGLPALALVFHPDYEKDFTFVCEGLGEWHGKPSWQVHFEQRAGVPARIHDWEIGNRSYPARLKGRAWISASTYQPLHLETDLIEPIQPIALEYEHTAIEYAPVKFPDGQRKLWLPASAEVYSRFRGHFFRQQHDFSNFILFSVNTKERPKAPGTQ